MVDAPERIYLHPSAMTLYPTKSTDTVEYVRADIATSQLAEVREERDTLSMHLRKQRHQKRRKLFW